MTHLLEGLRARLGQQVVDGVAGDHDHGAQRQAQSEHLRPHREVRAGRGLDRLVHERAEEEHELNNILDMNMNT